MRAAFAFAMTDWKRPAYLTIGIVCVILAGVGVVLPLVPTTPFLLLAAACFSRSSTRLHRWLLNQRTFGPILADWEQHRVVRLRVKVVATSLILALISYPLLFGSFNIWLKIVALLSVTGVLIFLWTRPSTHASDATPSPGA